MESHLQAVFARIDEIEARLGALRPPAPPIPAPPASQTPLLGGLNPANRPFDVMLAQSGGKVQLRPLDEGAGPFSTEIDSLAARYAAQNNLSPELVRAVIQAESGGNPRSASAVGAKGLMQLMPDTARAYGVTDAFDPEQNIAAGTRLLAGLMREFNNDIPQALAAYNAGSAAVKKYGGVPPFAETQQYVQRITRMLGNR